MDLSNAINVIESVAGFTDADTPVGEAWAVVLAQLESAPVPVAERLPGPEDCDSEGTCWMWHPVNYHYCLCRPDPSVHTHWLPHYALPVPTPISEENLDAD